MLWVGNLGHVKRPDIALELARRLPGYRFAIVGGSVPSSKAYFERIADEAKALPNVVMTGAVSYDAVGEWFERSRSHVNTSDSEGFPNTFLQAWIRSVPVVSFFDLRSGRIDRATEPGSALRRYRRHVCCFPDYNEEQLVRWLQQRARIVASETVSASGRKLFAFERTL